jgi:ComF family protein
MRIKHRQFWLRPVRLGLDFVLPPRCHVCAVSTAGAPTPWVCQACWQQILYITAPLCAQCGLPLAAPPEGIASAAHRCGACLKRPPPYTQARAVGLYRGVLRDLIHAMKYRQVYGLVRPLAALLLEQFSAYWGDSRPEALVPVPLHHSKLREREFDQALALTRYVGKQVGLPVWPTQLVRHRRTVAQVSLNATQRRRNVRRAFRLTDPSRCAGRRLLLIDDVYTTGATTSECARLLRRAGAAWIGVYTLARVGSPHQPGTLAWTEH